MNRSAKGYLHVRVDGEIREILPGMRVDCYKNHSIEILIDKLVVSNKFADKLKASVRTAMKQGSGLILIQDVEQDEVRHYSRSLMCPTTGCRTTTGTTTSFNSSGCLPCEGIGYVDQIDIEKIIPNPELSIAGGGIVCAKKSNLLFWQIATICEKFDVTLKSDKGYPQEAIERSCMVRMSD